MADKNKLRFAMKYEISITVVVCKIKPPNKHVLLYMKLVKKLKKKKRLVPTTLYKLNAKDQEK